MSDVGPNDSQRTSGMTYADYAALPDDGRRYQLVEGELVETPSPTVRHQSLVGELLVALTTHTGARRLGEVIVSPMDVVFDERTVLQPDLLFVSTERLAIVDEANVKGAPDLCVEVLSPPTAAIDRLRKLRLYARFGVAHYWIVDPEARSIEEHVLAGEVFRVRSVTAFDAAFRPALFEGLEIELER